MENNQALIIENFYSEIKPIVENSNKKQLDHYTLYMKKRSLNPRKVTFFIANNKVLEDMSKYFFRLNKLITRANSAVGGELSIEEYIELQKMIGLLKENFGTIFSNYEEKLKNIKLEN